MGDELHTVKSLGEVRQRLRRDAFFDRFPHPFLVQRVEVSRGPKPIGVTGQQTVMVPLDLKRMTLRGGELAVHPIVKRSRASLRSMITVGRDSECDIVVDIGAVSRVHAFFSQSSEGRSSITDTESSYGTAVNGRRLVPREQVWLEDCAVITLADAVEFTYYSAAGLYTVLGLLGFAPK